MGMHFDNAEFHCTIIKEMRFELAHYISLFFVTLDLFAITLKCAVILAEQFSDHRLHKYGFDAQAYGVTAENSHL